MTPHPVGSLQEMRFVVDMASRKLTSQLLNWIGSAYGWLCPKARREGYENGPLPQLQPHNLSTAKIVTTCTSGCIKHDINLISKYNWLHNVMLIGGEA